MEQKELRELKFRAWHKPTQRMFPVHGFDSDSVWEDSFDGPGTSETLPASRNDCVLLQYTGMKDKNDKEIWEYDVVRVATVYHGKESNQKFNAVIVYNDYCGCFQISYNAFGGGFASDFAHLYRLEVIGTLPENPKLMDV